MKGNKQINICPMKMIRVAKDLSMEKMAEYFGVTGAYISAIEKGDRSMRVQTLLFGLYNLGIYFHDYEMLESFSETLLNDDLADTEKYKFMLIKTLGVVDTEFKNETQELLEKYYYSKKNDKVKKISYYTKI